MTDSMKEDLVFAILSDKRLSGLMDDINQKTEWWIRITYDNPSIDEIKRRYFISCLY